MQIKIPWQITKWTSNFLSKRKKEKEDHKASKPFTPDAGRSEGSIVGIILFKGFVYKQIFKKIINFKNADDVVLYYTHGKQN